MPRSPGSCSSAWRVRLSLGNPTGGLVDESNDPGHAAGRAAWKPTGSCPSAGRRTNGRAPRLASRAISMETDPRHDHLVGECVTPDQAHPLGCESFRPRRPPTATPESAVSPSSGRRRATHHRPTAAPEQQQGQPDKALPFQALQDGGYRPPPCARSCLDGGALGRAGLQRIELGHRGSPGSAAAAPVPKERKRSLPWWRSLRWSSGGPRIQLMSTRCAPLTSASSRSPLLGSGPGGGSASMAADGEVARSAPARSRQPARARRRTEKYSLPAILEARRQEQRAPRPDPQVAARTRIS